MHTSWYTWRHGRYRIRSPIWKSYMQMTHSDRELDDKVDEVIQSSSFSPAAPLASLFSFSAEGRNDLFTCRASRNKAIGTHCKRCRRILSNWTGYYYTCCCCPSRTPTRFVYFPFRRSSRRAGVGLVRFAWRCARAPPPSSGWGIHWECACPPVERPEGENVMKYY